MRLLLDTHVFVWCVGDSPRLRLPLREILASPDNLVFVSAVSIWEIAIKLALGKLDLRDTPMDRVVAAITASGFNELPITALHAAEVAALPRHHSDPFDRLLVAQARFNDLTLVTEDHWIERYDVQTIGAA